MPFGDCADRRWVRADRGPGRVGRRYGQRPGRCAGKLTTDGDGSGWVTEPPARATPTRTSPRKCQGGVTLNVRNTSAHPCWTARAFAGVNVQAIS